MKRLNIALDYDGTYTADPTIFKKVVKLFQLANHTVICLTMRYPHEEIDKELLEIVDEVVYTSRLAKMTYCQENDIKIDIWIDDTPKWIFQNG